MSYFSFPQEEINEIKNRTLWLAGAILLIISALLVRTWYLQVFQGNLYREMSENNRMRLVEIPAPRGFIYDRNGNLLLNNTPSFNLYLVMEDISDLEETLNRLSSLTGLNREELNRRILTQKSRSPFQPLKIKSDLTLKEVAFIKGHLLDLPGVRIEAEAKRNYLYGKLAAHLLGYSGEINAEQLSQGTYGLVSPGATVGQYGIEKTYDAWIRGKNGQKTIEVDVQGYQRKTVQINEPLRGNSLYLTIDLHLQREAEAVLEGHSGAVVAMDPWTGDILAMASYPAFDPNMLSGVLATQDWEALVKDPGHPLNNRVIQGQYPPGSVFKLVVSAALLETNAEAANTEVDCKGGLYFGNRLFRDWKRGGHGTVNLHKAIVESCDVFFYEAGRELGIDVLAEYAQSFGLGSPTRIPLASEKEGLIPTKDWKLKIKKEPWYPGETLPASIGQGYITVTPLQIATLMSALATNGYQYQPRILKRMEGIHGRLEEAPPVLNRIVPLKEQTLRTLRRALRDVVSEEKGTGQKAYSEIVEIGGKTGTAQVVGSRLETEQEKIPRAFRDHAWFTAMAPVEHPEIVVVVLVEHGGHGGATAAPIAKQIIEEFFRNDGPETDHAL